MEVAKARLAGRAAAERRPPCFFDPATAVDPRRRLVAAGGEPRPGARLRGRRRPPRVGRRPATRRVDAAGAGPVYDAPGYFGPYRRLLRRASHGIGGFLPALLVGVHAERPRAFGTRLRRRTGSERRLRGSGGVTSATPAGGDFGGGGDLAAGRLLRRPRASRLAHAGLKRCPDSC